jgi:hypothetical protein
MSTENLKELCDAVEALELNNEDDNLDAEACELCCEMGYGGLF